MKRICIVGLGYVGLPLAVAFAEKGFKVIGFDINKEKIEIYKNGIDPTLEVGSKRLKRVYMEMNFTSDEKEIRKADFIIVAVPTPVLPNNDPDLRPVIGSSEIIGRNLKKGSIVVYESTVYPGATEEECIPVLEKESNMKCGPDFKVGYSPERINPGDRIHTLEKIVKVVSGMDEESLKIIASMYELVIDAGVHRAPSIKVAEASKVIENTQRDINIAFMNELSKIFDLMNIDTKEVLEAASTKWNFLKFHPGLVGGHCIGVDPFYLANKAVKLGYDPKLILSARNINDSMAEFISTKLDTINDGDNNKNILIMGLTFKEDCPDLRNTKVIDIYNSLVNKGYNVEITDPYADKEEAYHEYGINLVNIHDVKKADIIILAVAHNAYRLLDPSDFHKFYKVGVNPIMIDIKSILNKEEAKEIYNYWRL
ncbi:MAG: UDP-N-acetyl-D-glucosamine 6-dehydrogenase [Candidatus Izimaplasma bacterium HR2]|nr:MAG: UDP-N-acetyl-D-glucosamine 6-dehydrogenase [Candidatus Izimaplasma bacterium HR2]